MNRRTLLLGGLAVAGLAAASSETVRTVVLGHVQDGVSRCLLYTSPSPRDS